MVKNGDGISNISIAPSPNDFDYLGHDVSVGEDHNVFKITYTTSKSNAMLMICFKFDLGLWHPIALDGNNPPQDNNAPETRDLPIPRQDLEITGDPKSIDLSTYFTDPDDEHLIYTAPSSDLAKATTFVSRNTLTITSVAAGVTTVTVTASDGSHSASTTFTVVVYKRPPIRGTTEMSGIVDPYEETSVESKDGSLTVTFPAGSMSNYYQARIDPESNVCGTQGPEDNLYLCFSVDLFDLAADPIDGDLAKDATMVLTLDQTQATAVKNAIDDETLTFSLSRWDRTPPGSWTPIPNCPGPVETSECYTFTPDSTSGTIEVINISGFSDFRASIPAPEPLVPEPIVPEPIVPEPIVPEPIEPEPIEPEPKRSNLNRSNLNRSNLNRSNLNRSNLNRSNLRNLRFRLLPRLRVAAVAAVAR